MERSISRSNNFMLIHFTQKEGKMTVKQGEDGMSRGVHLYFECFVVVLLRIECFDDVWSFLSVLWVRVTKNECFVFEMGKMEKKREVFVERVRSVVLLFLSLFFGEKRGNPKIKRVFIFRL